MRKAGQRGTRWFVGTVPCIASLAWLALPDGACGQAVTAARDGDFLNSLGVCTHIGQGIDNASQVATALAYLGVRNIRDDASSAHVNDWISIYNQTGVKTVLTWSSPNDASISSMLSWSKQLANAGALLALEGPNEPNNFPVTYDGQTSSSTTALPTAQWQAAFYSQAKADPVLKNYPVFASSEAGGSEPDNVGLQYLTIPAGAGTLMPAGTQYADYANVHNYICRQSSIINNMAWLNASPNDVSWADSLYQEYGVTWSKGYPGYTTAQLATLPKVTTETGWPTSGSGSITQAQQGKLYLNMYLDQYKEGFSYTFMYMLRDDSTAWGLVDSNYNPKLSGVYLHNLTTILADHGSQATPGQLGYSIANEPTTVHDLLLQKSNGTFELAVWDENTSGSDTVTVNLGGMYAGVNLYDPTVGTSPIQTLGSVSSVQLTLSDHPQIIEVPLPEPGSVSVLAVASVVLMERRRRG